MFFFPCSDVIDILSCAFNNLFRIFDTCIFIFGGFLRLAINIYAVQNLIINFPILFLIDIHEIILKTTDLLNLLINLRSKLINCTNIFNFCSHHNSSILTRHHLNILLGPIVNLSIVPNKILQLTCFNSLFCVFFPV